MKLAAALHPLLDRFEEAIIRRVGRSEFLPVARGTSEVRQTLLLGLCALGIVSRIAIGDQRAREILFSFDTIGSGPEDVETG